MERIYLWLCYWRNIFVGAQYSYLLVCLPVLVAQPCPTLGNPMDCSPPGSSVHGILWARILQWVAIPFSRGSSWSRDWTHVSSCIAGMFFTTWAARKAPICLYLWENKCKQASSYRCPRRPTAQKSQLQREWTPNWLSVKSSGQKKQRAAPSDHSLCLRGLSRKIGKASYP